MKPWFVGGVAAAVIGCICFVVFVVPAARQMTPIKDRQAMDFSRHLREQLTLDGCVSAMRTDCVERLQDMRATNVKRAADSYSQVSPSQASATVEAKNQTR